MTKAFRSVTLFSLLCFLTVGVAWGQTNQANPIDSQIVQSFGVDSINLQNLSVGVHIPVFNKQGAVPLNYSWEGRSDCTVVLDGSLNKHAACGIGLAKSYPVLWANYLPSQAGPTDLWELSGTSASGTCASDGHSKTTWTNLSLQSPHGQTYYLPAADTVVTEIGGTACTVNLNDYTTQGGIHVVTNNGTLPTVTLPNGWINGQVGTPPTSEYLKNPFGNQVSLAYSSLVYTDTLNNSSFSVSSQGPSSFPVVATYKDTSGASQTVSEVYSGQTLKTAFSCTGVANDSLAGVNLLGEVDYPDGNNLYFTYEPVTGGVTGRIHQITYRTGGTASYAYGSLNCASMIPSSITRTTADGATSYTFALNGTHGTTTTVLDPGKNKTIYYFQGTDANGLPVQGVPLTLTEVQVYQNTGTVASPVNTLLSTTINCYNNNATACPTTQAAYPILHKDVYVAPGSKATYSRTHYDYDNGCGGSCGLVTSVVKYASFVAIGAGTADNTTTITYGSYNGTNCVAVGSSIINLPCDVKTTAGANTLAESRYTYSSKGFQTQVQQWNGTSSLWITASASPNTNGTVASSTSPLGIATTYSYAATGSGGCNAMLPTGTSKTVNSVVLTIGATWDCNMGKLMSATDANSNTSNFTYDLLGRPLSQADPLTYTLSEAYPSATSATLTDSTYFTTTLTVDGLGRPIRSQRTDGASYDTVSTAYGFTTGTNPQWQISSSQPCIATLGADCTLVHAYIADPIGRAINTHTTSNETVATAFNQNDASTTLSPFPSGEHNKTVQTESDGMGRVLSTCALQITGGTACGQVDGNSGILNSYTYSYNADGSTNVVNVRGGQNHTDVFDTLGRDASVFRPEHGTISYTYDKTSVSDVCRGSGVTLQGLLLKKTNNDSSYECYQYDPDGKLTDIGIANGSGVFQPECRRFRYDATSNGIYTAPTGYTANNIKGRILEASTDDCTFPFSQAHMITDEWFAYDDDGRISDVWETTPHSSGWYHSTAAYALNGQLTSISGVPGASAYTIVLDGNGRPYTSKYGTTVVGNGTTYNATGQATEIDTGTGSDKDVYTYDASTGLMKTWAFTINSISENATLTWNANRSLKTLAITDGFNSGGTQTCHYNPTDAAGSGYDDVGRLVGVNCGTPWTQTYSYDQYNNFSKSGTTNWNPGYNSSNNFITGGGYDGAGRVTYDLNNSYAWNVYGKMITANTGASLGSCGGAGVTCITYDAFGQPAEKNVGGTITEMLYSPIGLTGIMSGQTTNFFGTPIPGGSIFTVGGNWLIYHRDWLGSARLTSTLTGHAFGLDTAYSPYGEKYATFGTNGQVNFTGDYQNLYSGLYDTPNREFDTSSGSRWLSPDPARASWNAYSYPTDPNSFIDPLGLDAGCADKRAKTCRPIAAGNNDFSDLGGGIGSDTMNIGGVDVSVPGGALTLLMSGIPVYFGSSGTTSAEFTSTTFNGSGGLSNVTVVNVSGTDYNAGTGAIIGNGLQPNMTAPNTPGIPSKHVKPQIHSPYKMKPILPVLIGMADNFPEPPVDPPSDLFWTTYNSTWAGIAGFGIGYGLGELDNLILGQPALTPEQACPGATCDLITHGEFNGSGRFGDIHPIPPGQPGAPQ